MHGDLEKIVASGKIPHEFAERLDKFSPGKYVMHPEWGVGKVEKWSLTKQKVKIKFESGVVPLEEPAPAEDAEAKEGVAPAEVVVAEGKAADAAEGEAAKDAPDTKKDENARVLGLKLAFSQLTPIPEKHFLIKCYDDPQGIAKEANGKDTMLSFIKMVLTHNYSLREGIDELLETQPDDLERFLSGRVIAPENWKSWWEKARAAMRNDPHFRLPTKRGEAIRLREASNAAEALLSDYEESTTLESCVRILDQAQVESLEGHYDIVARLVKMMELDIEKDHVEPQRVLELIIIRNELLDRMTGKDTQDKDAQGDAAKQEAMDKALSANEVEATTTLADKLKTISSEDIVAYIGELSAARQAKVFADLPKAYPESWLAYTTNIFLFGGSKVTATAAQFIIAQGAKDQLFADLLNGISRQTLSPDVLIWLCKERNGIAKEVVDKSKMALGAAIINAIERDSAEGGPNRALRLRNLLLDDKDLAPDLVTGISELEARPLAKALYDSSVIPELDRNLLLAQMMKVHPSLQEIVLNRTQHNEKQSLFVSLRSFAARKAEYEDLINVRIPKNKHDLEITRAEGDLRENGGYQDAKATRQVLMRRSEELSRLLAQAEPTDFRDVDCSETGMGTQVTFETEDGKEVVYTILGAWDSVPEERIVSYSSKLGVKLTGHKVGDTLRLPIEIGGEQMLMKVKSIAPAPKALIYPDDAAPEA